MSYDADAIKVDSISACQIWIVLSSDPGATKVESSIVWIELTDICSAASLPALDVLIVQYRVSEKLDGVVLNDEGAQRLISW
ncbi:hypothetical protein ColTof4_04416 [Colletotrichum tofieldiae]|nr:hypothetical protein ColTof3_11374 [Colletotrichum tofieldiae]GKT71993.1 hypothetical protein ColTof4_04416 [Colletotrichum tofieldiae]GKT90227.1 hypothetical protein Ct61P_08077 [Colletotrichum tofieldiae]